MLNYINKNKYLLLTVLILEMANAQMSEPVQYQNYFIADSLSMKNIEQWTVNVLSVNAENVLEKTNLILEQQPEYLNAHLLKGLLYYYRLGNITKAVNEFDYIEHVADKLSEDFDLSEIYQRQINGLTKQTKRQLNKINREFGNLKVGIKGVDIDRYCYIKNLDIAITVSEKIMSKANYRQKLRFSELEKSLRSGNMKPKFSTFDSTDNRYYFEIPYFPLVDINSNELPYSMIINNAKRYHFILDRQNDEMLEIDWNNEWKFVETVPDNNIKLEFPLDIKVQIAQPVDIQLFKAHSIPEQNPEMNNLYINTSDNEQLQLVVSTVGNSKMIEQILYYSNKAIIALGILSIVMIIR